jgi:hypothetical protein
LEHRKEGYENAIEKRNREIAAYNLKIAEVNSDLERLQNDKLWHLSQEERVDYKNGIGFRKIAELEKKYNSLKTDLSTMKEAIEARKPTPVAAIDDRKPTPIAAIDWENESMTIEKCRQKVLERLQSLGTDIIRKGEDSQIKSIITKLDHASLVSASCSNPFMLRTVWEELSTGGYALNKACRCPKNLKQPRKEHLLCGVAGFPKPTLASCFLAALHLCYDGTPVDIEE